MVRFTNENLLQFTNKTITSKLICLFLPLRHINLKPLHSCNGVSLHFLLRPMQVYIVLFILPRSCCLFSPLVSEYLVCICSFPKTSIVQEGGLQRWNKTYYLPSRATTNPNTVVYLGRQTIASEVYDGGV